MKEYEDKKFAAWKEMVESALPAYLKRNLLTRITGSSLNDDFDDMNGYLPQVNVPGFGKAIIYLKNIVIFRNFH